MRNPKLKAQPKNVFFTTVNQTFGGNSQLLTMISEQCSTIWFDYHTLCSSPKLREKKNAKIVFTHGKEIERCPFNQKFQFWNGNKLQGKFPGKIPENPEIDESSQSEPFNRKFREESQMELQREVTSLSHGMAGTIYYYHQLHLWPRMNWDQAWEYRLLT